MKGRLQKRGRALIAQLVALSLLLGFALIGGVEHAQAGMTAILFNVSAPSGVMVGVSSNSGDEKTTDGGIIDVWVSISSGSLRFYIEAPGDSYKMILNGEEIGMQQEYNVPDLRDKWDLKSGPDVNTLQVIDQSNPNPAPAPAPPSEPMPLAPYVDPDAPLIPPKPPEGKIRVENELKEEEINSETTLWPYGTIEKDGVSTTIISEEEFEALLELARQHEKDTEALEGEGIKEGVVRIEDLSQSSKNQSYALKLTRQQMQTIEQEQWNRFTVQTPIGDFSLYDSTLTQTAQLAEQKATDITIEPTSRKTTTELVLQRAEHEGRPALDAVLRVGGEEIHQFSDYGVRLVIAYAPTEDEQVEALAADYLPEDGQPAPVTESYYNEERGGVVLYSSHLSKFGVVYRATPFDDVSADHRANPYVTFLAARGIVQGGEGQKFRPNEVATRADVLSVLTRAISAARLPNRAIQVFSDVSPSSEAGKAASWLYYNNLAAMLTQNGTLKPQSPITREELAALLSDTVAGVRLRVRSMGNGADYIDLDAIDASAKQAVVELTQAGVFTMPQSYRFSPQATLNRGEMAEAVSKLIGCL